MFSFPNFAPVHEPKTSIYKLDFEKGEEPEIKLQEESFFSYFPSFITQIFTICFSEKCTV